MLVRRLLGLVPVILGVSMIVFLLMHLAPGDPVQLLVPEEATQEDIEKIKTKWGLDQPVPIQYWEFLKKAIRGDFGISFKFEVPVMTLIQERLPATVELGLLSFLISIMIAIPIGVLSATRANTFWDNASMAFALMGASLPHFWLGIMLIFFLGGYLDWLPVSGRIDYGISLKSITHSYLLDSLLTLNWSAFLNALKHILMPALTLGIALSSLATRITRSSMLEVLQEDYVRTAHAKGLRERVVLQRHALKNAFLPVITIIGLQTGSLLAGAILTETIFSWPGIGKWVYDAILGRDYPIVQSGTLLIAAVFVIANLLVDLSYAFLDPRIHYE